MTDAATQSSNGNGGCGCITIILTAFLVWATCCGVTVNGKHYDTSCSCDRGVEVIVEPTERGLR